MRYGLRGGDDARLRERVLHGGQAEVIVRIAMADVDGGQLLAAGADLLDQPTRIAGSELRVDQDRIVAPFDQHRGHREHRLRAGMEGLQAQLRFRGAGRRRRGRCGQQRGAGETCSQREGEQQGSGTHGRCPCGGYRAEHGLCRASLPGPLRAVASDVGNGSCRCLRIYRTSVSISTPP
ncbi:hypothetical protein D3C72_1637900 [compost metagenome]